MLSPKDVIQFWFEELKPSQWFGRSDELDATIRTRFAFTQQQAARCELEWWRETPQGRLAEILVLDQFSRNIFRNDARAFATDPLALALAQEAIRSGASAGLKIAEIPFLYMPFMHSESLEIHQTALKLFAEPGLDYNLKYEQKHLLVLERFGRYPQRNLALSRTSTPEEIEFLKDPANSF